MATQALGVVRISKRIVGNGRSTSFHDFGVIKEQLFVISKGRILADKCVVLELIVIVQYTWSPNLQTFFRLQDTEYLMIHV